WQMQITNGDLPSSHGIPLCDPREEGRSARFVAIHRAGLRRDINLWNHVVRLCWALTARLIAHLAGGAMTRFALCYLGRELPVPSRSLNGNAAYASGCFPAAGCGSSSSSGP